MAVSPAVVGPALACAVFWGIGPIFSKKGMDAGGTPRVATAVIISISTVLFWTLGFAIEGTAFMAELSERDVLVFLSAGVFGTVLGRIFLFTGVELVGASINTAGLNSRPLFVLVLGVVFLGEYVTPLQVFGILIIVVGVVVLSLSKGGDIRGWDRRQLIFPLLAAASLGLANVIRRYGLSTSPASPLEAVALNEAGAILLLLGYGVANADEFRQLDRRVYGLFAVNAVLGAAGLLSLFIALDAGPVTIVDPLAGTAPLFTTAFAYLLLRDVERISKGVVLGAVCVTIGGIIVTLV